MMKARPFAALHAHALSGRSHPTRPTGCGRSFRAREIGIPSGRGINDGDPFGHWRRLEEGLVNVIGEKSGSRLFEFECFVFIVHLPADFRHCFISGRPWPGRRRGSSRQPVASAVR